MLRRHNRSCILDCYLLNDDHACVPSPRTWSKAYGRSPWDEVLSSFPSHAPTTSPRSKCIFLVDVISCIFLYFNRCCLSHHKYVINLNSFSVVTWTWTWTWNSRDCNKPESDVECIIQVHLLLFITRKYTFIYTKSYINNVNTFFINSRKHFISVDRTFN